MGEREGEDVLSVVGLVGFLYSSVGVESDILLTIAAHAIVLLVPMCCRSRGTLSILGGIGAFCSSQSVNAFLLFRLRTHFLL